MGKIVDIITGQEDGYIGAAGKERSELFKNAADQALKKMTLGDRLLIKELITTLSEDRGIRSFGEGSAKEVLMEIGILLATMSDTQFEELLESRRKK